MRKNLQLFRKHSSNGELPVKSLYTLYITIENPTRLNESIMLEHTIQMDFRNSH